MPIMLNHSRWWFSFLALLLLLTPPVNATNRTKMIHEQRMKTREALHSKHGVGPPPRPNTAVDDMNASVASDSPAMRSLLGRCTMYFGPEHLGLTQQHLNRHFEAMATNLANKLLVQNPDHGTLPGLRRELAKILICWRAAHNDMVPEPNQIHDSVVREFFEFYTDAVHFRTAIYFLHISKAGGTSFCAVSYENGCRDPNFHEGNSVNSWRHNCWSRHHDDGPKWTIQSKGKADPRNGWWATVMHHRPHVYSSCLAMEQEVISHRITFLMNENWLLGGRDMPQRVSLCNHFMNVVLFREPVARILSHIQYFQAIRSSMPVDVTAFMELAPIITNNYYLRILLGEKVYQRETMNFTEADLFMAMRILDTFDVIMTLETLNVQSPIIIRRAFGWEKNHLLSLNQHKAQANNLQMDHLTEAEKTLLHERNAYDIQLYSKAAELAELDFEFFRQVQYLAERDGFIFPEETQWKAFPSLSDPSIQCEETCGYICHIRLKP